MYKLGLEKAEEPEIKLPTFTGSAITREFQKNIYFCIIAYAKAFDSVSSVQLNISGLLIFATPWTEAGQELAPVHHQLPDLLKLMSIELVIPSNHLILSSPSPPAFNLSQLQDLFQ